jgi:putative ABC transport system permease protein
MTRLALGAGRPRLARQLAVEHVLLALVSSTGGLGIGYVVLEFFRTLGSDQLPGAVSIRMDAVIVSHTLAAAVLIGIVLGAVPVATLLPVRLADVLHEGGRAGTSGRGFRTLRRSLIVGQLGVAFMLLLGAGLLLASFQRVLAIDPGFEPEGVLTASFSLPAARYADGGGVARFGDELLRAVRSLPGVVAAGLTSSIPMGPSFSADVIFPEGHTLPPGASLIAPQHVNVTPGYFEVMRVRLVSGRFFDERDRADAPKVVIVDETLARLFWPGVDPVGKRMYEPSSEKDLLFVTKDTEWYTVVGVVGDVKLRGLAEGVAGTGAYYMVRSQEPSRGLTLAVRTAVEPSTAAPALRQEIMRLDAELPLFDVQTMTDRVQRSVRTRRASVWLAVAFGVVALFLSAVGLFGVLAYVVAQRTKEIGIRMALGSPTAGVVWLVLQEGLLLVACGLTLGAGGGALLARALDSQLFGVRPTDPVIVALAAAILTLVALAACALPVRRATEIDPVVALAE